MIAYSLKSQYKPSLFCNFWKKLIKALSNFTFISLIIHVKETLNKSLSGFTLEFLYIARNKTDTNSELFKEGYDEAMYNNSCRS